MQGYLSIILHAHLPFVRHPEHDKFLEENWLYEAITETYIPLIQVMDGWQRDRMNARLTLTLSPTLCAMLQDPLLQDRYQRYLDGLIELSEKETHRTHWDRAFHDLAWMYNERFLRIRDTWQACSGNLLWAFRRYQELGTLEIITTAATHGLLPLLADHRPSLRGQILTARDHYRQCFGVDPRGIWLPECAYSTGIEDVLQEANLRWFTLDTHGLLHATPRPRYGVFAPVYTPNGVAAFGRDLESAKQVWSKHEGYPGEVQYRDFYRDIGYDLDFDYVRNYLPNTGRRSFTGIKYYRITGGEAEKQVYNRLAAMEKVAQHAADFLAARVRQVQQLSGIMDRPPIIVSPYDAELFGHWWYEGPEFLDYFVRKVCFDQDVVQLATPTEYLQLHPTQQIAAPSPSSWGEEGYWKLWLNETNDWIYPHLTFCQERMTELARKFPTPDAPTERALKQAARELLLAQASDWPFILRTGTSPEYARRRVKDHLLRFNRLFEQLMAGGLDERYLQRLEWLDNIFPDINPRYWA
jgi:1,4-alpha-glucan branching enzyme